MINWIKNGRYLFQYNVPELSWTDLRIPIRLHAKQMISFLGAKRGLRIENTNRHHNQMNQSRFVRSVISFISEM
jgi:hypothetical protein